MCQSVLAHDFPGAVYNNYYYYYDNGKYLESEICIYICT